MTRILKYSGHSIVVSATYFEIKKYNDMGWWMIEKRVIKHIINQV